MVLFLFQQIPNLGEQQLFLGRLGFGRGFRGCRFRFSRAVCVPLLFISLYPFVWYAVIRNHSMVHFWMTHRNLAVTFFCLTSMVGLSLQKTSGEMHR